MNDLTTIIHLIAESQSFLVTSHENPDADAVGSMLALGTALKDLGKETKLYNRDKIPEVLTYMKGSHLVKSTLKNISFAYDCTFILDCTDISRVGKDFYGFFNSGKCGITIIVDHHQTTKPSADYHLLYPNLSSTGMIVYEIIKSLPIDISRYIAEDIYTTIIGDTGSFRYSNTTPQTLRVAAELIELGASPDRISQALYESESPTKLELLSYVLPTLGISENGKISYIVITADILKKAKARGEHTDGIVDYPRSIKGIEVAVLFREVHSINEQRSKWKISLRSKGGVDVARIAEMFCGGGHYRAAGCSIDGSLEYVKDTMIDSIQRMIV